MFPIYVALTAFLLITSVCSGQLLSPETQSTMTFCSLGQVNLECGNDFIVVEAVLFAYRIGCESNCCTFDAGDCFISASQTDIEYVRRICSGYRSCNLDLTGSREFCNFGTIQPSYVTVQHYCIPETRILSICSSRTISSDGLPLYLSNENYPSVTIGDSSCSCSLEVYNCSSNISVYTIDVDLYFDSSFCEQSIKFVDGSNTTLNSIDCENYYDSSIVANTLNTHYVNIKFIDNSSEDQEGYFFFGFHASSAYFSLTCSSQQESWCVECGTPPSISDGYIELNTNGSTNYDDKATITCNDGYETEVPEITCLANATWKESVCRAKDCGPVPLIEHGNAILNENENTTYGSQSQVTCETGYETNVTVINCNSSGLWEDVKCIPKDCGPVVTILHGYIEPRDRGYTSYGATANVTCDMGYESTTKVIVCLSNGIWEKSSACVFIGKSDEGEESDFVIRKSTDGLSSGYIALIICLPLITIIAIIIALYCLSFRSTVVTPTSEELSIPKKVNADDTEMVYSESGNKNSIKAPKVPRKHEIKHGHVYIDHGEAHIFGITIHLPHPFAHSDQEI